MTDCPFCKDISVSTVLLPGTEAACFHCGRPLVAPNLERPPAKVAAKSELPAARPFPAKPKEPSGSRLPIPKPLPNEPEQDEATGLWNLKPAAAAAFFCGSLGICLASVPSLSFLTKPLSVVGLALGIFGGVVPALNKNASPWLPGAISALSLFVLLFVGSWPKSAPPPPPPLISISLDKDDLKRVPLREDEWTDAATHAISLNNLRVQLMSVHLEDMDHLVIHLQINLDGIVFKLIPYESWANSSRSASKHPPILVDDSAHAYVQKTEGNGAGRAGDINPGRSVNDVLVFQVPLAKLEKLSYLRLTLPGGAFSQEGEFRFQIPRAMVERGN